MLRVAVAIAPVLALAVAASALTGCAVQDDGKVHVVAAFYPLAWAAGQVAGPDAEIEDLTTPGVEPHDLELTVRQTAALSAADVVLYEQGFQPAVDSAVKENARDTLEVGSVVDLKQTGDGVDPHFWHDPARMADYADAIGAKLAKVDPAHAEGYRSRAAALSSRLGRLDRDYATGLRGCRVTTIVVSHDAFGYLSKYGLRVQGIAGLSPDAEPSAKHIREIQDLIDSDGITSVFSETLASPKLTESLARDLDLRSAVLDPIEGVQEDAPSGTDYLSLMRGNLRKLERANSCP
jgi:zinc transport system substrate-binding protein